jgi:uncharacterized membrane protein
MNIKKLKESLLMTFIGVIVGLLWLVYAILTNFNFIDFITNPSVISVLLILAVPLAFLIADKVWGDK